MVTDNRPLSPHLQVYRPQLTSVMSISHRISGILLSLGMVVVVLWVLALASGPEAFERINSLLATPFGLIAMLVWTFSLFYHLLNGIRHLLWDAGWLLDLRGAYASGWIVLVASVVMTAVVWGGLL
jgi:succinate dehydrogenase / fumarate reductase, cytochrome b subunit